MAIRECPRITATLAFCTVRLRRATPKTQEGIPALAERLQAAESELARLRATSAAKAPNVGRIVPRVAERYRAMLARLEDALRHDTERGRAALQNVIGSAVTLQPDKDGEFMWAEYGIETAALLQAASGGKSTIMVAGAGFEPATFGL